jgi:hypothetical protein
MPGITDYKSEAVQRPVTSRTALFPLGKPGLASHKGICPFGFFFIILRFKGGYGAWVSPGIQGYKYQIGSVNAAFLTPYGFHKAVYPYFQTGTACPGYTGVKAHCFVQVSRGDKVEVIHLDGYYLLVGMPPGFHCGNYIDPGHKLTAKEPVGAIHMGGPDNLHIGSKHNLTIG